MKAFQTKDQCTYHISEYVYFSIRIVAETCKKPNGNHPGLLFQACAQDFGKGGSINRQGIKRTSVTK